MSIVDKLQKYITILPILRQLRYKFDIVYKFEESSYISRNTFKFPTEYTKIAYDGAKKAIMFKSGVGDLGKELRESFKDISFDEVDIVVQIVEKMDKSKTNDILDLIHFIDNSIIRFAKDANEANIEIPHRQLKMLRSGLRNVGTELYRIEEAKEKTPVKTKRGRKPKSEI
jgi:hypothetical protein